VSISPGDILEFVGARLRFEKSSPRWRIVGKEEIEEIKTDSTEIENQRSKNSALKQARKAPVDRTIDRWRRPVDRPVDRCAQRAQEYPGRPTDKALLSV